MVSLNSMALIFNTSTKEKQDIISNGTVVYSITISTKSFAFYCRISPGIYKPTMWMVSVMMLSLQFSISIMASIMVSQVISINTSENRK